MVARVKSRIPLIIASLDEKLLEGVTALAEEIADEARERVPVDSGALRNAIHVETDEATESVRVVAGDDDAFYGHIVENGGVKTPPRPFLVPAYESKRQSLHDIVGEPLEDL